MIKMAVEFVDEAPSLIVRLPCDNPIMPRQALVAGLLLYFTLSLGRSCPGSPSIVPGMW